LIEKASFRWYYLLKFLGIQVAKRTLYRLVQEALSNAVKETKARNVGTRVDGEDYMLFCLLGTTTGDLILARYVQHMAGRA